MAGRVVTWLVFAAVAGGVQAAAAQQVGPAHGALVLVGGSMRDPVIVERFLALAGGPAAPIVLIPTAGGDESYDQAWPGAEPFRAAGARRLTVVHTTERAAADTEAFVEPIRRAGGVWFGGGRQWRLADAYLDTKVHDALRDVLARGGVVGGSSAGATILGSYLVRGDTRTNTVMMGDHEEGFGLLRGVGIDQHLLRRNRQFDLVEVLRAAPRRRSRLDRSGSTPAVLSGDQPPVRPGLNGDSGPPRSDWGSGNRREHGHSRSLKTCSCLWRLDRCASRRLLDENTAPVARYSCGTAADVFDR